MKYDQPLTSVQRAMVEEHLMLIKYALGRVPLYRFDSRDDAYQIGAIGLIKAARSFDLSRNVPFPSYATQCILNELYMALRHINCTRPMHGVCSLDSSYTISSGETVSLADILSSEDPPPEESVIAQDTMDDIVRALKTLPEDDAFRIIQMVMHEARQTDIASYLGCTQSAISRKLRRIRAMLRKMIT